MSEEILAAFAAESRETIAGLEEAIRELEAGASGALDRLFRHVHTLKGSAGIVGLDHLATFAHAFESRLSRLREGSSLAKGPKAFSALWSCRDRLSALLSEAEPAIGAEEPSLAGREDGLSEEDEAVLLGLDEALVHLAAAPIERGDRAEEVKEARRQLGGEAFARVAASKLERILLLSSEVAISLSNLFQSVAKSGDATLLDEVSALENLASALYRSVLETRLVSFEDVVERYRLAVEDIARSTGKQIRFILEGGDTEIEKGLADRLFEPLLHLVRNAADHGVEALEARQAAGKGIEGSVTLSAHRESSVLCITVEDDGKGIDAEAVRKRAMESGFLAVDSRAGEGELMACLFEPGFSLSPEVTKWSGRGVGLDVVKKGIEALRGSVTLSSRLGSGSKVAIKLPLTLSLVEGFVATVGNLHPPHPLRRRAFLRRVG